MANVTPADVENITLNFTVPVELSMDIIAAVNILFSITASLGIILILFALRKVTSLHPSTKLLFQCLLAITDLGVVLTSEPLFANMLLNGFRTVEVIIVSNAILSIIFSGLSLLISTALGVDRLLALLGIKVQTRCNTEESWYSCCLLLVNCFCERIGHIFVYRKDRYENSDEFNNPFCHYYLTVLLHENRS